jgi:hypothetical protein
MRRRLERIDGVEENLRDKLQHLMASLTSGGEKPCLGYLVSDFRADASEIEAALCEMVDFSVVGGFAAGDHQMAKCYLYANREVVSNALVVLAAYGKLRFSIAVGNSLQPVGSTGEIEVAAGAQIDRIDGLSAMPVAD